MDGIFKTGPVFHALHNSTADIVVLQGGTDSGKTVAAIQEHTLLAISTKPPVDDPVISIVNKSVPDAKKGAYRKFEDQCNASPFISSFITDWNKSDRVIKFSSGWVMEFLGAIDEQTAKQGKRQYLFANEVNGISWQIFWQYAKRTRIRTTIDYNPSAPFFVHDKLIGTTKDGNDLHANVQLIISDHRHNPFLSEADHAKTENIKDKNLWNVYARGKTGNLIGIIYPNWTMIPDADFPWGEAERLIGGIDFGYTNDPTAAVVIARIANNIYIHELCYQPAMTPIQIVALYKSHVKDMREFNLYCEHDGDMIKQIRMAGLTRAIAARKGPNSINPGITKVKEYSVFYTASSANIDMERKRYMWQIDEDTGKPTNEPTENYNHLMDAIRYAIYTHFYRKQ